jgi:hypothetical protein
MDKGALVDEYNMMIIERYIARSSLIAHRSSLIAHRGTQASHCSDDHAAQCAALVGR